MQNFYHIKRDNNPLREEAFTLSCLGKLFPASSRELIKCGRWLSELLDQINFDAHEQDNSHKDGNAWKGRSKTDYPCKILIVGLTESGIIPAFLMYREAIIRSMKGKSRRPHLVYSTRRSIPGIPFNEIHSHGPDHILPINGGGFDELWIVEDEITSGNTVMNLMTELQNHMKIKRVRVFAFTDFRNDVQKERLMEVTAENDIHCSVHIPVIPSEISGLSLNTKTLSSHGEELSRLHNSPGLYFGCNPSNPFNSMEYPGHMPDNWYLQHRRPALGVKNGILFDPEFWRVSHEFSKGSLLVIGESVDMAASIVLANPGISFQQISLSPWKVDNENILSRMEIGDRYYLYNHKNLMEPVFILYDPVDADIGMDVVEKMKSRGMDVKPFLPAMEFSPIALPERNGGRYSVEQHCGNNSVHCGNNSVELNCGDHSVKQNYGDNFVEMNCEDGSVQGNFGDLHIKAALGDLSLKDWCADKNYGVHPVNDLTWNQMFYINLEKEVDPFKDSHLFRPLERAYNGDNTFWSTPSPEPDLDDEFWREIQISLERDDAVQMAARRLAGAIAERYPDPKNIVFVSILRAGVPVTDWLCRLLPGSVGTAISLFVGLGIDLAALERIRRDFPHRSIIFVDGWTGRGGVARAIAQIGAGPLAVLMDPWGWADFSGVQSDLFCPSACFTGVATLGFSRTFFVNNKDFFSAYRFAPMYTKREVVCSWQGACPESPSSPMEPAVTKFHANTPLRIHSNEVCRALINAAPEELLFACDRSSARERFSLLLDLGERRSVPVQFNVDFLNELKTGAACTLKKNPPTDIDN
ncbi:MAG: phosphoribosyltransferase domain-containing protein [Desulfamplus sp.]|nr:phosphoribosyltransferase domain-containing protein [Desulfamplus sp.]